MKRTNRQILMAFALVVVLMAAAAGFAAQSAEERPGYKEFVEAGCYECHGYEGQGGGGPRLAPDPLPWEAFSTIVRKPPSVMPAYSPEVLTEERLERIYEYVKSIPPPLEASDIPMLAAEE